MPYLVRWTANALTDLGRAYSFLSGHSEEAAVAAIKAIREKALLLEQFPDAGRPADDFDPEYREVLIPFGGAGYVFVYAVLGNDVHILALKHQREAGY